MTRTIEERYAEFVTRADKLARELSLEIEFTTEETSSYSYYPCRTACAEVLSTDSPYGYACISGRLTLGGKVAPTEPTTIPSPAPTCQSPAQLYDTINTPTNPTKKTST